MTDPSVLTERPRWTSTAGAVARAVALGVILLPSSWTALSDSGIGPGWTWALRITLVVLHLTVLPPLVTAAPLVAFSVGSAAMLVLVTGPDLGGSMAVQAGDSFAPVLLPSSLVWFVLLYAVASRTRSPWPSAALAVGGVGSVLTVVRLWDATDYAVPLSGEWGWRLFVGAAVIGGTLAAWALGRYRAARLAWTEAVALRAAALERRRIAREMHDVVAHSLAVVVAQAEGGRLAVASQPQRAPEILDTIAVTGREALGQMRGLLGVLRDEGEDEAAGSGPHHAATSPQPSLGDLPGLVERLRSAGTPVDLETRGTPRHVAPTTELAVYRMVQESLTNVVKHAGAGASARVTLDWSDGLVVEVSDDGAGGPALAAPGSSSTGRGLQGMRDRVESVGGALTSGARPGGGWQNRARIPS